MFLLLLFPLSDIGSSLFATMLEVLVGDSMLVHNLEENIGTHGLLILPPLV